MRALVFNTILPLDANCLRRPGRIKARGGCVFDHVVLCAAVSLMRGIQRYPGGQLNYLCFNSVHIASFILVGI